MNSKSIATVYAILAAALYAINVPLSKVLLNHVDPTMMASFLYLGAGIGLFLFGIVEKLIGKGGKKEPLTKKELPYTIAMVILDIVAPILLMLGIARTNSANVSLLNNFEIVATSIIALVVWFLCVLILGFVAYGLSINFYIMAQKDLGAAKTSAYYSVAPFLGVAFSMILLKERPSLQFFVALIIMIFSTVLMVKDTIELQHTHEHRHGDLVHTHLHTHSGDSEEHGHEHKMN